MHIAEFSRATGLTPRVLRLHHHRGLLVPAAVDPATGYRSYDPRQVAVARRLAALVRTGMDAEEAAAVAAEGSSDGLQAHLRRVEEDLALLRAEVAITPGPELPVIPQDFASLTVLVREEVLPVHGVAEGLRRVRAQLRAVTSREPASFPTSDTRRPAPIRTAFHVELVDPRWTGDHVHARVLVPWRAGAAVPAGWQTRELARRSVFTLDVGALVNATLTDVLAAHRALTNYPGWSGPLTPATERVWQLYDADLSQLWVGRESVVDPPAGDLVDDLPQQDRR